MANLRREMIDMENAHEAEVLRLRFALAVVGVFSFLVGALLQMAVGCS